MANIDELTKEFGSYRVPDLLMKLAEFETDCSSGYFSESFEFSFDPDKYGLKTYSENEVFLNSFVEFAQADAGGSTYAVWIQEGVTDLNSAPIVVFGSEGGVHVIAKDMSELLEILAYDAEPMVDWDEVFYYRDEDEEG